MNHKAIDSIGATLVLVMKGKIVCKVNAGSVLSDGVTVSLHKADFDRLVFPLLEPEHQWSDVHELVTFRFGTFSGAYLGNNLNSKSAEDKVDDLFGEALLVRESQLYLGRVPDHFKEVEGYRARWLPVNEETTTSQSDQA